MADIYRTLTPEAAKDWWADSRLKGKLAAEMRSLGKNRLGLQDRVGLSAHKLDLLSPFSQ